jgi:hypothetical protein
MNQVLATERLSQARLVEARTKPETQRIDAEPKAEARRVEAARIYIGFEKHPRLDRNGAEADGD